MFALQRVGFGQPVLFIDDNAYPITAYKVTTRFRSRLAEGLHDDVAVIRSDYESLDFLKIASESSDNFVIEQEYSSGQSGSSLLNSDNEIIGVLSRTNQLGSVFSGVSSHTVFANWNYL